jgi:hypothetical protein
LFDAALILSIIYLILAVFNLGILFNGDLKDILSLSTAESYFKYLAIPVGILALNFNLLTNKSKILVLSVLAMIFLVGIFRARRGMIFMTGMISFFAGLNFLITSKKKINTVFYILYACFGVFIIFFYSKGIDIENISFFKNISERGLEDTRSYVEDCFYNDMSFNDWIFGKGFYGGYKCSGIDEEIFKEGIRKVIETDYLQLIMNGGIVNLFLLFLVVIPAIVLGLFYSKNNLVKMLSIWIFLWLIFLYPANVYSLNLFHVSIWLCVGICNTKPIRMFSNSFIINYFLVDFSYKPDIKVKNNA